MEGRSAAGIMIEREVGEGANPAQAVNSLLVAEIACP